MLTVRRELVDQVLYGEENAKIDFVLQSWPCSLKCGLGSLCLEILSFLASVFPISKPLESNATEFLASLHGYGIMLGPLIVALLLLIIHLPRYVSKTT